ncbi:soma ferritin-like [Ostrea edulis]|uniref:soma ferritin-like n=1 Tax=Ostrea edulis TaxID=37623 RepID=UPI0024AF1D00|nr:soma ferritin-like [Ostrea edulis]
MRVFVTALFGLVIALLGYHGTDWLGGATAAKVSAKRPLKLGHVTQVQQNFAKISRKGLNKLITECLNQHYQYLAMANYFDRADMALPGFRKYFAASAEREYNRAKLMMEYMNKRGGTLSLMRMKAPVMFNFSQGKAALELALKQARQLNIKILLQNKIAMKYKDPSMKLFLDENLVDSQVELIKQLGNFLTHLELMKKSHSAGLALYMFDLELQK